MDIATKKAWEKEQPDSGLRDIEIAVSVKNLEVLQFKYFKTSVEMFTKFDAMGSTGMPFRCVVLAKKHKDTGSITYKVRQNNFFETVPAMNMPLFLSLERILKRYLLKVINNFEVSINCLEPKRSQGRPQKYSSVREAKNAAQRAYRARLKEKEKENG